MKHMIRAAAVLALMTMTAPAIAQVRAGASWRTHGAFAALRVNDVTAMSKWYAEALGFRLIVSRHRSKLRRPGAARLDTRVDPAKRRTGAKHRQSRARSGNRRYHQDWVRG
jgi:hypothetical protein